MGSPCRISSRNTSGVIGVTWFKPAKLWAAIICVNRKRIHLGYFHDFESAVVARKNAEKKYFNQNYRMRPVRQVEKLSDCIKIPLTRGFYAYCDLDDFHLVNEKNWHVIPARKNNIFYAATQEPKTNKLIQMHRLILGLTDHKIEVDHIDHDGLNNRRNNLRTANDSQQLWNQRRGKMRGVTFKDGKWQARLSVYKKRLFLGRFPTKEEALNAYKVASKKYCKGFECYEDMP